MKVLTVVAYLKLFVENEEDGIGVSDVNSEKAN